MKYQHVNPAMTVKHQKRTNITKAKIVLNSEQINGNTIRPLVVVSTFELIITKDGINYAIDHEIKWARE